MRATDIIDLIIEILRGSKNIKQAKACLMTGTTEGIRFKSKASERAASALILQNVRPLRSSRCVCTS